MRAQASAQRESPNIDTTRLSSNEVTSDVSDFTVVETFKPEELTTPLTGSHSAELKAQAAVDPLAEHENKLSLLDSGTM